MARSPNKRLDWRSRRMFGEDATYDDLTPDQQNLVQAAESAWMNEIGIKGNATRRLNAARRLREKADALEAAARGAASA